MIRLYTTCNCSNLLKAKSWLTHQNISFEEVKLSDSCLLREVIISLLPLIDVELTDIVCKKNRKAYKRLIDNEEPWTVDKFIDHIIKYPQILQQPIICDDTSVQFGFDIEEIRVFIPKGVRIIERNFVKEKLIV